MISTKIKNSAINLLMILTVVFCSVDLYRNARPVPEYADSLDNLKIAFNLAKYNKFSASNINGELTTQEGDTLEFFSPNINQPVSLRDAQPTALREPLPIWLTSLILKKLDLIKKYPDVKSLNTGKPLMLIKSQNFVYLVLLFGGLAMLLGVFVRLPILRFFATVFLLFLTSQHIPARFFSLLSTELLACLFMVWCCYFLLRATKTQSLKWWILAGFLFGLLILTKAAFIYIGFVFMFLLLAYFVWLRQLSQLRGLVFFALVSTLVVLPWMLRNYQELHFFGVSERAADVLLVRAEKNLMTPLERKGALCFYTSNEQLRKKCAQFFGFKDVDLSANGRLRRIYRGHAQDLQARSEVNPSKTISFYYHATTLAYQARYVAYLKHQSIMEANNATSKIAIKKIIGNFGDHVISTFLFAYRGLNILYADFYSYAGFFAIVLMGFIGVIQKNTKFLLVALLPTLTFSFYAFLSHFIPRYADPLIPFWMLGLIVVAIHLISQIARKIFFIDLSFIKS
jgi:4-amino-4-deoxy-L-arabinose transferase-like glycosyltransferase